MSWVTIGFEYATQHAVGAQACSCPADATRAAYRSALHPDTAEACAFAPDVKAKCAWCDNNFAYLHQIEGGTYKAVANTASGNDVHILYADKDETEKEFKIMRKLRNEYHITCVPRVQLYTDAKDVQKQLHDNYSAVFGNVPVRNTKNMMFPPSRLVWFKQLSSGKSLGYATEENVGLDLSKTPPADYDPNTTAYNMISLLQELRVLMSPKLGCFHCDVKNTNMACKLARDSATGKKGLKFYVIDWGFCVKFDESADIFKPLKAFSDLRDLQNRRPSQLPPELVLVSLCILLYLHGSKQSFSVFCQELCKMTMEAGIAHLRTLTRLAQEKKHHPSVSNNIKYSRFYSMKCDYMLYVKESHLCDMWTLVTQSLNEMQTSPAFHRKTNQMHSLWNQSTNFSRMNRSFTALVTTCMCKMFALARWGATPDVVPELALLQRMDTWAYSCTLREFWDDHILQVNKESLLCQGISEALMQVRYAYNNPWSALCMHLRKLRTESGLFSKHLEHFFSDLENEKHYNLCDINLLRNDDVVKTFNSFLCGQPANTDNPTERFIYTLKIWLHDSTSAKLADIQDLPSYVALCDYAESLGKAKKQKTGQARRWAAVVAGAKH